jgi:hypothetical protein
MRSLLLVDNVMATERRQSDRFFADEIIVG